MSFIHQIIIATKLSDYPFPFKFKGNLYIDIGLLMLIIDIM